MPARTVVLERLSKFTGESHELLQPGDYTQLTGRAGRRGIDTSGTAVVLHSSEVAFERVAAIAAEGAHPLASSFQPNYNMAVNLIANYPQERAEELLAASFAQFRSEHRRTQLAAAIEQRRRDAAEYRSAAACDRGDIELYVAERGAAAFDHASGMRDFVQRTHDGDVLQLSSDPDDRWVLLARGWGANPRLLVLSASGEVRKLAPDQLPPTFAIVGSMPLPEPVKSRDTGYRRRAARQLQEWQPDPDFAPVAFSAGSEDDPVGSCPDLPDHLAWLSRARRTEREIRRLERRLGWAEEGLVELFHTFLRLLDAWGYTRGWALTEKGTRLRFVYNELDLLLTESITRGHLDGLQPAELAALASLFTYEARLRDIAGDLPTQPVAERTELVMDLAKELNEAERGRGLPETRSPDPGFASLAYGWAGGADLEDLFDDDIAAGDFVRNSRQLLDLLRQLRDAFPRLEAQARVAIRDIDRGVVAAGGRL
jgi:ATP-dependent RNA helicase HelY